MERDVFFEGEHQWEQRTVESRPDGFYVFGQEVVYYDIDFSSSPHTVGLIPSTGTGSDRPSSVPLGQPAVVSSYGILTNQPLLFHATSDLHQIRLEMNKGFDIYTLEFDVYMDNLRDSDYSFTVDVDTPQVQNYDFHGANVIKVFNTTIRVLLLMRESDRS